MRQIYESYESTAAFILMLQRELSFGCIPYTIGDRRFIKASLQYKRSIYLSQYEHPVYGSVDDYSDLAQRRACPHPYAREIANLPGIHCLSPSSGPKG